MKVYRVSYQQFYVEEEDTCIIYIVIDIESIYPCTYNIIVSWYRYLQFTRHGLYFYSLIVVVLYFWNEMEYG